MTYTRTIKISAKRTSVRSLFLAIFGLAAFIIFFIEAPVIIERMKNGLLLCAKVIIPSLFPYIVLSELLIFSGLDALFERTAGGFFSKLFKLPRCTASAFILGILCGFPVGTKIAYSLYKKGKITNEELFHLILICNVQSSAFIINTVGISLLGSKNAGVFLYISEILALLIIGTLYPKFFPPKNTICAPQFADIKQQRQAPALAFTSSVKSSVSGILSICGFVLFFYVLCGIILDFSQRLRATEMISLTLCSMLEMSCGCIEAAGMLNPQGAFLACAIILGFSGISLHFQIMSLCPDAEIKYGRFFIFKIFTATIAGICAIMLNFIFKIFV